MVYMVFPRENFQVSSFSFDTVYHCTDLNILVYWNINKQMTYRNLDNMICVRANIIKISIGSREYLQAQNYRKIRRDTQDVLLC